MLTIKIRLQVIKNQMVKRFMTNGCDFNSNESQVFINDVLSHRPIRYLGNYYT